MRGRTFDDEQQQKIGDTVHGGHIVPRSNDIIRETLDWFDRYLGPVSPN